jgi:hypothetical protein
LISPLVLAPTRLGEPRVEVQRRAGQGRTTRRAQRSQRSHLSTTRLNAANQRSAFRSMLPPPLDLRRDDQRTSNALRRSWAGSIHDAVHRSIRPRCGHEQRRFTHRRWTPSRTSRMVPIGRAGAGARPFRFDRRDSNRHSRVGAQRDCSPLLGSSAAIRDRPHHGRESTHGANHE